VSELLIDRHGAVTVFTMNRPERHNALSTLLLESLTQAVTDFREDPDQKVLIITGAGDKAFCSGADLKNMQNKQENPDEAADTGRKTRPLPLSTQTDISGIAACEKPVIAAINGLAIGGGLEIAICCDIRLATEDAYFALPEPAYGFIAGLAAVVLPRLMPIGAVMDMMLASERLTAQDAYRLGLVQQLTTRETLMAEAMRRAELMASNSQVALWGTKHVIRHWRDMMLEEQHRFYKAMAHRVLLSGDMIEGIKAFTERRNVDFGPARWPDPFDRS
jgi:enoyl-CoA hydratase/carnithine racemase